jgi:hypothetical protein
MIDRGADVDTEIKNLTYEDKAIKTKLYGMAEKDLQGGETGVKFQGNVSAAVVSTVEKFELESGKEQFAEVQKAVDAGLLAGIVEKKQELAVPASDIEKAADILKKAGIKAMIAEGFSVVPAGFREMDANAAASAEQGNARKALKACVSKTVSYRVKYERV